MKIRLLFQDAEVDGDMPTLIEAVDEYTEDIWGGTPDFYAEKVGEGTREVIVRIADADVCALFVAPEVAVEVVS